MWKVSAEKVHTTFLQQISDDFSVVLACRRDERSASVAVRLVDDGLLRILNKLQLLRGQHRGLRCRRGR